MTFERSLARKPRKVADRAREIAERARAGATAHELGAKRMRHSRSVLSVAIGRGWRVVLDERDGALEPRALMSHEAYSAGIKAGA